MPRLTWLHLSDLHANSPQYGWDSDQVLRTLTTDLKKLERDYGIQPDLLLFTGDAAFGTFGGIPIDRQFEEAWRILDGVRTVFPHRLPKERCFFVPGNHDVDRDSIAPDNQAWLDQLEKATPLIEAFEALSGPKTLVRANTMARFGPYRKFLETTGLTHCGVNDAALLYTNRLEISGLKVGIAGFNSAIMCSKNGERGRLWMASRWQVSRLVPQIEDCDLKIALVHHPDSWLHEYEDKLFKDLSTQVDFVLHGHEHDGWVDPAKPAGAATHTRVAAAALYDRSDLPNGYSVGVWDSESRVTTLYLREYSRDGRGWRGREIPSVTDDRGRWPAGAAHEPPPVPRPATEPGVSFAANPGYSVQEIASGTVIQEDGDCYRVVEFNEISVQDGTRTASGCLSRVYLSVTTGYIDPDFVRAQVRGGVFPGFRLPRFDPDHPTELTLNFGRPLAKGDRFSLEYSWWSLNGFAMDEAQFRKQYGSDEMEELAHMPVLHNASELILYVLFPRKFVDTFDLKSQLSVQVTRVDERGVATPDSRMYDAEADLRPRLRFVRQLGLACLRIEKPEPGLAYGISWRVPPFRAADPGVVPGVNREILAAIEARLLSHRLAPDTRTEEVVRQFFDGVLGVIRNSLLENDVWSGDLELSLMVLDKSDRQLKVVSGLRVARDGNAAYPFAGSFTLPYGVGVAGKAYKTNVPGLWVRTFAEDRSVPDPFVKLDKNYAHRVLLSIPLQNPGDSRFVFAIVNCGSDDANCPLARLQMRSGTPALLKDLQKALSVRAFSQLRGIL